MTFITWYPKPTFIPTQLVSMILGLSLRGCHGESTHISHAPSYHRLRGLFGVSITPRSGLFFYCSSMLRLHFRMKQDSTLRKCIKIQRAPLDFTITAPVSNPFFCWPSVLCPPPWMGPVATAKIHELRVQRIRMWGVRWQRKQSSRRLHQKLCRRRMDCTKEPTAWWNRKTQ